MLCFATSDFEDPVLSQQSKAMAMYFIAVCHIKNKGKVEFIQLSCQSVCTFVYFRP
jgi:hypothetical protein